MAGKNLINSPDDAVNESLTGCVLTYPHLELHVNKRVVLKPRWNESNTKVSIISGGGSGHEPFAAGFVGDGMLTASVAGSVFASPPSGHVLHAIQRATKMNNNAGCLLITPNYTGDVLNFGLAMEHAKHLGCKVAQIEVGEDCSIPDEEIGIAGKRCLPGIVLVIKVAGALSELGRNLDEIKNYAQLIADNTASCSIGLTACTIPKQGRMFEVAEDEFIFGQGIHGEAGYEKLKSMSANSAAAFLIRKIEKVLKLTAGSSVVVLVNNFGGLSQLEQGIFVKEAVTQLTEMKISVHRVYSGLLMTSLDGVGIHLTILKLPENKKMEILSLLDAKTDAPKWPGCSYSILSESKNVSDQDVRVSKTLSGPTLNADKQKILKLSLEKACAAIIEKEQFINDLDRGCGDADCGTTLKHLADGIMSGMAQLPLSHPASLLFDFASIAEDRMGGTSGALYSLMFTTAATKMSQISHTQNWIEVWAKTWRAGLDGILKYSRARVGDKSMIDVLEPCLIELENSLTLPLKEIVAKVSAKATMSSEATKNMIPRAGRASYVKQKEYLDKIDAGAYAVATWINAISNTLISGASVKSRNLFGEAIGVKATTI